MVGVRRMLAGVASLKYWGKPYVFVRSIPRLLMLLHDCLLVRASLARMFMTMVGVKV